VELPLRFSGSLEADVLQAPDAVEKYFGGLGTRPPRSQSAALTPLTDANGLTDLKDTVDCPKGAGGLECSGRGQ
jgi:hypothetical protein